MSSPWEGAAIVVVEKNQTNPAKNFHPFEPSLAMRLFMDYVINLDKLGAPHGV